MSKKEGEILKNYLKANGHNISKFAKDMGFSERQGLYYHLKNDVLDYEFKEKAAGILGISMDEVFSHMSKGEKGFDGEKEALRDLVDAQKQIMTYWKEIMAAQLLRNEYYQDEILRNQSRLLVLNDPEYKDKDPKQLYMELKAGVEERIRKDHGQNGS